MEIFQSLFDTGLFSEKRVLFPLAAVAIVFLFWMATRVPVWFISILTLLVFTLYTELSPISYEALKGNPNAPLLVGGAFVLAALLGVAIGRIGVQKDNSHKPIRFSAALVLLGILALALLYFVPGNFDSDVRANAITFAALLAAFGFVISAYRFLRAGVVLALFIGLVLVFGAEKFLDHLPQEYLADYLKDLKENYTQATVLEKPSSQDGSRKSALILFSNSNSLSASADLNTSYPGIMKTALTHDKVKFENVELKSLNTDYIRNKVAKYIEINAPKVIALPCPANDVFPVRIASEEGASLPNVALATKIKNSDFKLATIASKFFETVTASSFYRDSQNTSSKYEKLIHQLVKTGSAVVLYNDPSLSPEMENECYQVASNLIDDSHIAFADVRHAFSEHEDDILYLKRGLLTMRGHRLFAKTVVEAAEPLLAS